VSVPWLLALPVLAGAAPVLGAAPIPAGNRQTAEKVELGRILFFDQRVMNGAVACATCHDPAKGWSDGLPRSRGPNGELDRNSLSLFNAAYEDFPSWAGDEWSLEQHNADAVKFLREERSGDGGHAGHHC
jgi:cytochrome c peroxidase